VGDVTGARGLHRGARLGENRGSGQRVPTRAPPWIRCFHVRDTRMSHCGIDTAAIGGTPPETPSEL
jgi:hypothetical protein